MLGGRSRGDSGLMRVNMDNGGLDDGVALPAVVALLLLLLLLLAAPLPPLASPYRLPGCGAECARGCCGPCDDGGAPYDGTAGLPRWSPCGPALPLPRVNVEGAPAEAVSDGADAASLRGRGLAAPACCALPLPPPLPLSLLRAADPVDTVAPLPCFRRCDGSSGATPPLTPVLDDDDDDDDDDARRTHSPSAGRAHAKLCDEPNSTDGL